MKYSTIVPKEVTVNSDTNLNVASFDYYDGINFAKLNDLAQTTSFGDVNKEVISRCGNNIVAAITKAHSHYIFLIARELTKLLNKSYVSC